MEQTILIALGANRSGRWGLPQEALSRLFAWFENSKLKIIVKSNLYETEPIGGLNQPAYINGLIKVESHLSPEALITLFKQVERQAGRRGGRRWGPRPLDIDILDYKALVRGWSGSHVAHPALSPIASRRLILPHPEIHKRAFILKLLIEIAPEWRHPVFCASAQQLLFHLGPRSAGHFRAD